ncbi:MAG: TlpA disulfide reductase family protein [Pseudomonadota bacterium]
MKKRLSCYLLFLILLITTNAFPRAKSEIYESYSKIIPPADASTFGGWTTSGNMYNFKEDIEKFQGHTIVLTFFATWCSHCKIGLKMISKNLDSLKESGVKVIAVNLTYSTKKEEKLLEKYLKDNDIKINVIKDTTSAISKKYGVLGASLPVTFLIDKKLMIQKIIGLEGDDYIEIIKKGIEK